jgi:hypothetical protein
VPHEHEGSRLSGRIQSRGTQYPSSSIHPLFDSINQVTLTKEVLFRTAYEATRKLLCPSYQQVDALVYPRIVLLRSLKDTETASTLASPNGSFVWDNRYGFPMFHVSDGGVQGDQSPKVSDVSITSGIHLSPILDHLVRATSHSRTFISPLSGIKIGRISRSIPTHPKRRWWPRQVDRSHASNRSHDCVRLGMGKYF